MIKRDPNHFPWKWIHLLDAFCSHFFRTFTDLIGVKKSHWLLLLFFFSDGCATIHRAAQPCGTSVMGMRSRTGEPAALFLPSHVRVTVPQHMLKEQAIINFAELVSERLVLFSGPGSLAPRGQQWPLSSEGKHCILLSRAPPCLASKSIFGFLQNTS